MEVGCITPCPRCGEEPALKTYGDGKCLECLNGCFCGPEARTLSGAIALWNKIKWTKVEVSATPLTITLPIREDPRIFELELAPGTERLLFRLVREEGVVKLQWARADDFKWVREVIE